jgi:hypothetical protein
MGYDLHHQQRIVGLFAFERPSIEGLQHLFGPDFRFVARRIRMRSLLGGAIGGRSGMAERRGMSGSVAMDDGIIEISPLQNQTGYRIGCFVRFLITH